MHKFLNTALSIIDDISFPISYSDKLFFRISDRRKIKRKVSEYFAAFKGKTWRTKTLFVFNHMLCAKKICTNVSISELYCFVFFVKNRSVLMIRRENC